MISALIALALLALDGWLTRPPRERLTDMLGITDPKEKTDEEE